MPNSILQVAFVNVGRGPARAKVMDLEILAERADVIIGAEFGDREDVIDAFLLHNPRWRVLMDRSSHPTRSVPILFDTLTVRQRRWRDILVPIGYLGPQGAGADGMRHKVVNTARFTHRASGRSVRIAGLHMIASAFSTHGAEGARRRAAFARQAKALFTRVRMWSAVTVAAGDWNAEESNALFRSATSLVTRWTWLETGATKGPRRIDMIGYRRDRRVVGASAYTLETNGSLNFDDHRAVVAVLRLRNRVRLAKRG